MRINIFLLCVVLAFLFEACATTPYDSSQDQTQEIIETVATPVPVLSYNCGGNLGDEACDFEFLDQHKNSWRLSDHHGSIIILDFSTMWCSICMHAATYVQEFQDEYNPQNVIWVTILLQDAYGQLPTIYHTEEWATAFNIKTSPVLAADENVFDIVSDEGYGISVLPTVVIIDRNMINAHIIEGWNKALLLDHLDRMLGKSKAIEF